MTVSGTANYAYNGDEMLKSETTGGMTVNYTYDGDGQRIEKSNGTIYWYGSGGQVLDETNLSGSLTNEYVFFGGKRISRRDSSNNIFYYFADDLGTSREIVQSGQTSACYDADFYPYGGEITPHVNSCPQNYKFTGKERDSESGLDDFGARYYASSFGRFVSADWAANATAVPYANYGNPQSLNLYSYVKNNPTTFTDPDGHCDPGSPGCALTFVQAVENFAEHPGEWAAAFISGAAKAEAATVRANLGMRPSADDQPSNDVERAGAGTMEAATQTAAIILPLIGPGEGEEPGGTEGIYEFPDATAPGKTYVGQSGDMPSRLSQHASSGKLAEGAEVKTTPVPGGKTAREVAETDRIKELGGTRKQQGSQTSNQRLPVSDARMKKIRPPNNGQSQ